MPTDTKLAYSVEEAATVLGVSKRTMYHEITDGRLPTFKVRNRRLVAHTALEQYVRDRQQEALSEGGADHD